MTNVRTLAAAPGGVAVTGTGARLEWLVGRAVPYDTVTDIGPFTEEIAPGTFAESLRAVPALPLHVFHGDVPGQSDATPWPIGVAAEWGDRLDGLYGRWRLDSTPEAQDAARRAERGMLRFLSIRFQPDELSAQWTLGRAGVKDHVRWTRARLISTSLVSAPAYAGAMVDDVRSMPGQADRVAVEALDQVRGLAVDLGSAHVLGAITGAPVDMTVAVGLVRSAIASCGATAAVPELQALAGAMSRAGRGGLAVNLARTAGCIDRDLVEPALRDAHKNRWRDLLPAGDPGPAVPVRRSRRRRG